jgi:hypothetical protein
MFHYAQYILLEYTLMDTVWEKFGLLCETLKFRD